MPYESKNPVRPKVKAAGAAGAAAVAGGLVVHLAHGHGVHTEALWPAAVAASAFFAGYAKRDEHSPA